jgi:hypothetical protein
VPIIDLLSGKVEMSAEFKKSFAERMQGRSGADIHLVLKKARQSAILDSVQEEQNIFDVEADSNTVVTESSVKRALEEFLNDFDKVRAACER